jgi:hypothetical protein
MASSSEVLEGLHRTWIHFMIEANFREAAAVGIDGEIVRFYEYDDYNCTESFAIDLPPSAYNFTLLSESLGQTMEQCLREILRGREKDGLEIIIRVKQLEVEEGWKEVARNLIADAKNPNQGSITEKMFAKRSAQPYEYNGAKYASQSEIRIAQELEQRKVLFFPLPLAIRHETGRQYLDQREVDFLICQDGQWGILEVSYHPDRYEKDAEKDLWFKKSGILCVQHFTAERCFNTPSKVVEEFLGLLAKHKR